VNTGAGDRRPVRRAEEFFGPLGVSNIRTFVDPQNPTRLGVLMDALGDQRHGHLIPRGSRDR